MSYTNINKSSLHFNTKLYTGNGSTQSITGVGFQPDLNWLKSRSDSSDHNIVDAVRGSSKYLKSNADSAEATSATGVSGFLADGFSVGSDQTTNKNSSNFVSWNWKAGGAGSANTDGTINTTSTSVNTTAGFSISTYTGTGSAGTIGHGLGAVPKMIIIKRLDAGDDWQVYHQAMGNGSYIRLNLNSDKSNSSTVWNATTPTSSVFSVGTAGATNGSGRTFVAYCFAEKTGYSKFGSYVGNGNTNGTFVYTGFKPAFIIVKKYNASEDWEMFDNKRLGYNVDNNNLVPNSNSAEATSDRLDIVSNGFKFKTSSGSVNASGDTYIFMAFGQSIVGSNNVPATAR